MRNLRFAAFLLVLGACNLNRSETSMTPHSTPDGRLRFEAPSNWVVKDRTEDLLSLCWEDGNGGNYAAIAVTMYEGHRLGGLERSAKNRERKKGYRLVVQENLPTAAGEVRHLRFHGRNEGGTEHEIDYLFLEHRGSTYEVFLVTNDTSNESRDAILRSFRWNAES